MVSYLEDLNVMQAYNGTAWASIPYDNSSRNVLINGGMDIWQRGTGSVAPANGAMTNTDRWVHTGVGTTFTQQTDRPSGFKYSLGASGTNPSFGQKIESANSARLANQTVTFSIWAKNVGGSTSLFFNFYYPNSLDNFSSLTMISSTTITSAISTSWTRYTLTVNLPVNVYNGLYVLVGRSAGFSNTYYTGAQLEQSTQATPFEQRSIGTELALCQRYYERITGIGSSSPDWAMIGSVGWDSTTNFSCTYVYKTTKRARPSVFSSATGINCLYHGIAWYVSSSVIYTEISINAVRMNYTISGGTAVQGQAGVAVFASSSAFVEVSAEL
jgi:hypothetical protein